MSLQTSENINLNLELSQDGGVENSSNHYGADSIKVLKGLEAVKTRPGMYIGDTDDGSGLHHMVYEVVDNAIDEALAGFCTNVHVTINQNGSVTVKDNGRGIPTDIHQEEGISAAEVIMTQLHAGGKFDNNSYKISGGLHGVGVSVVNALSESLELTIWRNGQTHFMQFKDGFPQESLKIIGDSAGLRGSSITFLPSSKIFSNVEFKFSILEHRFRELAFLNSGVTITLEDLRNETSQITAFKYDGGIAEFAAFLDKTKRILHPTISFTGTMNDIVVECAMQWNDSYHENSLCFTNNIRQRDGGTHLAGFRGALTRTINSYANAVGTFKKHKIDLTSEDMREGLTSILSVKVPDPKFSSQTKDKLVSSEVRPCVESIVTEELGRWFEEHPAEAKQIITKIVDAAVVREAARKARDLNRKKTFGDMATLSGKLSNCQEKNPEYCELFLVEGESAGGTVKQGRDRKTQAVLPLKGKILNVERARLDKILGFAEIRMLITALGTSIGAEEFNIDKLRYHKVVIMTDADVDGAHIKALFMTFFYRYMPEVITRGHLFIAQPPLYKLKKGNSEVYLKDEKKLQEYLLSSAIGDIVITSNGVQHSGNDLLDICSQALKFYNYLQRTTKSLNQKLLEVAVLTDYFHSNQNKNAISDLMLEKFQSMELSTVPQWSYATDDTAEETSGALTFQRNYKGVNEHFTITPHSINPKEADNLSSLVSNIKHIFTNPVEGSFKGQRFVCHTPSGLLQKIFEFAKKGLYIQRFKGLGEMNPEQLWDTTLNPDTRTLLQVKIGDLDDAEQIFPVLMGELVEPRREFIQTNALKVENLDV
ncbi:DNA topoisomerase (ATP-hydrolyzing) subunit B [Rickettsiales endosymbiont of Peranema trichophorum]|uniref:DNA topoisomerase (ATP-hydrolyzing) subunit B n=1 Tax=Rickettsiales endosymbiont of Peranema trichophorum TaxID=2486577 RepID=UPI001023D90C|nr:DNA topoisomerase (ATP-hydrolyzing) subunit B [Rickettsiales endosymbiont of Peranema trichophorum]RZI47170.1 DNA topoisomerase (ATP-hydrolyzing) subunit B [Rickettsiales endosymbiont of Peranema trichophorum]